MLISESYRELNKKLHERRPDYGTSSHKWVPLVRELCEKAQTTEVLDYGCGKSCLKNGLGDSYSVSEYDPALSGKDSQPELSAIVVCTDVMEHIEPDNLIDVLDDLKRVTRRYLFMTIATGPAGKFLDDGRNAHLIQKPFEWWKPKLESRFEIKGFQELGNEFLVLLKAKEIKQ